MTKLTGQEISGLPILYQLLGGALAMLVIVACGISFYLVPLFEKELLDNERTHIRNLVESASSVVNDYYLRSRNGEFVEADAKQRALERLNIMRYDRTGYFWVNDMNETMLMHPFQPDLNGKSMFDLKDASGKFLFREFVEVCKLQGRGYVSYRWPEPGVSQPVEKLSYVKQFKPWGWVIGTGVYITEMEKSLAQLRRDLLVGTALIIAVLGMINIFIAIRIAGPINRLSRFSASLKDNLSARTVVEGSREIQHLAVVLNDTAEQLTRTLVSRDSLDKALTSLTAMQQQIIQTEKMASIGQLAAGVAHEINNPMGFINSNLATLRKYVGRLSEFIEHLSHSIECNSGDEKHRDAVEKRRLLKIDHILTDSVQLIDESLEGANRVKHIVQDLKSFSRVDMAEKALVNLNQALETTINIAWNEIKYVATLNREFTDIPEIVCYPQQLNQVFLNLLVNAAHAMDGVSDANIITVSTWSEGDDVCVAVKDTGKGIPEENLKRIFEPFFTTKETGKGTGLGLSISYDIIKKHGGDITAASQLGIGTTFTVRLPIDGPPVAELKENQKP